MSMNKPLAQVKRQKEKGKSNGRLSRFTFYFLLFTFTLMTACRYDMQDQPRYKAFKKSDFFADKKAMREFPEGSVARGQLRADKAFYTGKKENADPNAPVQTTTDASGNTLVSTFPNDIEKIPVTVTKELLDRGEERYRVFCIVCHGPVGNGDGMIVRRGFPKPPTYNDTRLINAPDGHFFDVITNGWGRMSSYASQIPAADRWAIVAYIRALQISQNPSGTSSAGPKPNGTPPAPAASPANSEKGGGK